MAIRKVLAHFMHESEREAARRALRDAYVTESYVLGDCDEADIPGLEAQGLIVEILDVPAAEPAEGSGAPSEEQSHGLESLESMGADEVLRETSYYLVQLPGPLLEEWRRRLQDDGREVLESMPGYAYLVRMTGEQAAQVREFPFVMSVRPYGPEETNPTIYGLTPPARGVSALESFGGEVTWDLSLHPGEDKAALVGWLRAHEVEIIGTSDRKVRITLPQGSELCYEVAGLPGVARMDPYVPPRPLNDVARDLLGLSAIDRSGGIGLTGAGQMIAVADTGLDETHPDFANRIAGVRARGRPGDASDPDGHGTHVTGSVLGDGAASGGAFHGVAPGATLFFQSLLDANGGLDGLPIDLGDLFEEAYAAGARIHNNSWGAETPALYTINATEVDRFVARRRDMLVVIAAGNEGLAADVLNSQVGFVDWASIGSPASSKNALTVGASRSTRTKGGWSRLTYLEKWPDKFPDPPIAAERISGNAESIAAFSSRGPCDGHRIKPDVVAPGTDIVSTKSSTAPLRNFWGSVTRNKRYAYLGGTSMAAPLVAGCAALVREYLTSARNHQPSAALLKAVLINGTRWLAGVDAVADHAFCPNYHQGFGGVYLPTSIPNPHAPALRLEFADTWNEPRRQFDRTGQHFRYEFSFAGGSPLRICLVYTDQPGRAVQNILYLVVEHRASRKKWVGNEQVRKDVRGPDLDNNVEVIRIEDAPAGEYVIQVSAYSLLHTPQDFALVVTGELDSGLVAVS